MVASMVVAGLLLAGASAVDERQGAAAADPVAASAPTEGAQGESRARLLVPLYVGNVALGLADVATTRAAIERGARESNPLIAPLQGDTWKMATVRMAGVATTIVFAEALRRRGHSRAAVVTMLAISAVNVAIVMHNYGVNRGP